MKELRGAGMNLVAQGMREESGGKLSWLVWKEKQKVIFQDLVDKRKEFGFDSKCKWEFSEGILEKEYRIVLAF